MIFVRWRTSGYTRSITISIRRRGWSPGRRALCICVARLMRVYIRGAHGKLRASKARERICEREVFCVIHIFSSSLCILQSQLLVRPGPRSPCCHRATRTPRSISKRGSKTRYYYKSETRPLLQNIIFSLSLYFAVSVFFSLVGHMCIYNDRRPQSRRDYPLNLSILLSGGKETNKDFLSSGERTGISPALNPAVPPQGIVVFRRIRLSRDVAPRPSPS